MCGLTLAASQKKNVGKRAFDLYVQQKHRGQAGFGYIAIKNGKIVEMKRAKFEVQIKPDLVKADADLVLFHHRLPTSTDNTVGTAHPITVSNGELEYDYHVMHNGCVSNDTELKKKHEELGYIYTTEFNEVTYAKHLNGEQELLKQGITQFNDSECLAIEAARFIEGLDTKMNNKGGAAFYVVQVVKGTNRVESIYFAQNYGRALGMKTKKGWTLVASEHGKEVKRLTMFAMNPKTFEITESNLDMDEAKPATPSPYSHYTGNATGTKQTTMGFSDKKTNKYHLENAHYTKQEVTDSGAPMTEFFASTRMFVDEQWQTTYVPTLFTGEDANSRPLFRNTSYLLPEPDFDKAQERLEELAMKYARKQHEYDYINDAYLEDKMKKPVYTAQSNAIELEFYRLEEEMSSLGIDENVVQETQETAAELVAFEYDSRR